MPGTRSPQRRADNGRRAQLISAARAVMAREGVAAATTRRITEEAGLPHGAFHYWFAGKEELFEEEQLFEEVVAEYLRDIADSAARAANTASEAGVSLRDLLRAAFDAVERDEQAHPGLRVAGFELTALALRTPALRDLARRQYRAYRDTAAEVTAPWMAGRRVDLPGGPDALNRLLAVLFNGLTLAWLADPDDTDPDELFTLIDALVDCHTTRRGTRDARSPVPSDLPAAVLGNAGATS